MPRFPFFHDSDKPAFLYRVIEAVLVRVDHERAVHHLQRYVHSLEMEGERNRERIEVLQTAIAQRDRVITEVRQALSKAATLEGIGGPVILLVEGLVRDHEELETRIEAVLTEPPINIAGSALVADYLSMHRVHHLLRGGTRVPDYPPDDD